MLASIWCTLVLILYFYEASKAGKSIGTQGLSDLVNKESGVILDVRDKSEYDQGHIIDAKNIPFREVEDRLSELNAFQSKPVIVVCKFGQQSTGVTKKLKSKGFTQVFKLSGGMSEWIAASLPLIKS